MYCLLYWNQTPWVGNPMLMKTLPLAGGGCWYSLQFPGFLTLSLCLFFSLATSFFGCVVKPLLTLPITPSNPAWQFLNVAAIFFYHFLVFLLFHWLNRSSHLSESTSKAWSGENVQRRPVSFFQSPVVIIISLLSVYSEICVRKHILGRFVSPPRICVAMVMASSCTLRQNCVKSDLRKQVLLIV